jgi:hypothetical protein
MLNGDVLRQMFAQVEVDGQLFDEQQRRQTFALSGEDITSDILLYAEFLVERLGARAEQEQVRNRRIGGDFRFIYSGSNELVREYLKRLEIGIDNKAYSCLIYALKQSGKISEDLLNKLNQRCNSRYLLIKHVEQLRDEFNLDIEVKQVNRERKLNMILKGKTK